MVIGRRSNNRSNRRAVRSTRAPKVFYANRPKQKNQATIKLNWKQVLLILLIMILIGGAVYVYNMPALRISQISISPANDDVSASVQSLRGASLFSSQIDAKQREIISKYLYVKDFSCKKGIPSTLSCTLTTRTPVIKWLSAGKQYAVDERGFLFNSPSIPADILTVEDKGALATGEGTVVVAPAVIKAYQDINSQLASKNLPLGKLNIYETLFQVEAVLVNGKSVLFNLGYSITDQVNNLKKIVDAGKDAGKTVIDVRDSENIYVR